MEQEVIEPQTVYLFIYYLFDRFPVNLLFTGQVLQVLTRETTPSSDLIATVKHLYETKLKVRKIFIFLLYPV